jgi:protein-disulfide isomerase
MRQRQGNSRIVSIKKQQLISYDSFKRFYCNDASYRLHEPTMSQTDDGNRLFMPILEHDHIQGAMNAPVILVAYGDYQCLSCGEVHRMIQAIQQQIPLCFVFRHFPRIHLHPQAQKAAEAAEAAAAQNKFWQMHNILFEHQDTLNNGYLLEYANAIQLDVDHFLREMTEHVHAERVAQDIQGGIQSGVNSVPALFINGTRYWDAWDRERLLNAIALQNT